MTWLEDMALRDLDEAWLQSPLHLLLKVDHRDVKLNEVAKNLACPRPGCRHVGVRLSLINKEDSSGFVGGMP